MEKPGQLPISRGTRAHPDITRSSYGGLTYVPSWVKEPKFTALNDLPTFGADREAFIDEAVKSGRYASREEVIDEALLLLKRRDAGLARLDGTANT